MKRIKQIIEALAILRGKPSEAIKDAFANILSDAESYAEDEDAVGSMADHDLVRRFCDALIFIAEDMEREKPAKGGGAAAGEAKS